MPDWHRSFFSCCLDGQVDNLRFRIFVAKQFPFPDRLAKNAVERLKRIGGVDRLSNVLRVVKQCVQILPMRPPATTDLRIYSFPRPSTLTERLQRFIFGR